MAKKNLQMKEDKQVAFQEEQKNLERMENQIRDIITEKSKIVDSYRQQIQDITIIDDSDRQQRIQLMEQKGLEEKFLKEYASYTESPYFGHMDMSDEEEDYSFYVGTKGLHVNGKAIIVDWRSPMGRTFYDKQKSSFSVEGILYDLSLRRSVDIQKAKLIAVNTEFDSVNLSLDGEVIDPFLLSVLEDKRRNRKLTNIIRSIQQNQNDIIGLPLNESFIVQGCAGSGKTMILLHRLSFIAFNYPKTNFSRVCILTPNENFNLHIDDLSKELGLDQIKKYTVEAFYAGLINSRMRIDTAIKNGTKSPKIAVNGKQIVSEKLLGDNLLRELYSDEFYDRIVTGYNKKAGYLVNYLNDNNISGILKEHQYRVEKATRMDFRTYSMFNEPIHSLLNKHEEASKETGSKEIELDNTKQLLLRVQVTLTKEEKTRSDAKSSLVSVINEALRALTVDTETKERQLEEINSALSEQLTEKSSLLAERSEVEQVGRIIDHTSEEIIRSESLLLNLLEISNREDCLELYEQIRELRTQVKNVPVYNFGKRRRFHGEIETLEDQLRSIIEEVKQVYAASTNTRIDTLRNQVDIVDQKIEGSRSGINKITNELHAQVHQKEIFETILSKFETEEFPDLKESLSTEDRDKFKGIITVYETSCDRYYKLSRAVTAGESKEHRLTEEIKHLKEQLLDADEYSILTKAASELQHFDFTKLYEKLQGKMRQIYEQNQVPFPNRIQYRHQLYVTVLLCTLYYGAANNTGYYLHIDEAQDLSCSEFRLLKMVLGDKTVFNIYGDVNQAIYNYKGIEDWEDLIPIIPSKLFFLNENYRNTIEITDYCNHIFGADVTAIGLHGEEVQELDFSVAMKTVESFFNSSEHHPRAAIIYKRGLEGVERAINDTVRARYSLNSVHESTISVLTIEEAKGLEFDAVAVIKDHMTVNEEYIAYTRALDHLIVTELKDERKESS